MRSPGHTSIDSETEDPIISNRYERVMMRFNKFLCDRLTTLAQEEWESVERKASTWSTIEI